MLFTGCSQPKVEVFEEKFKTLDDCLKGIKKRYDADLVIFYQQTHPQFITIGMISGDEIISEMDGFKCEEKITGETAFFEASIKIDTLTKIEPQN